MLIDEILKPNETSHVLSGGHFGGQPRGWVQVRALKKDATIAGVAHSGDTTTNAVAVLEVAFTVDRPGNIVHADKEDLFNYWGVYQDITISDESRSEVFGFEVHREAFYRVRAISGPSIYVYIPTYGGRL